MTDSFWQASYVIAALAIVFSIKWLSSPVTARRGVRSGEIGMLFAVIGTLLRHEIVSFQWIFICFALGAAIGAPLAYLMPMTAVPQLTALSHAVGALASALGDVCVVCVAVPVGEPPPLHPIAMDEARTSAKTIRHAVIKCPSSLPGFQWRSSSTFPNPEREDDRGVTGVDTRDRQVALLTQFLAPKVAAVHWRDARRSGIARAG